MKCLKVGMLKEGKKSKNIFIYSSNLRLHCCLESWKKKKVFYLSPNDLQKLKF